MTDPSAASTTEQSITDEEVEARIREFFEANYEHLRQDGGHALAEGTKEQALQQAIHYWRKLKEVATTVTDTEVKLSLPGQITPKGRRFVIEGVVDIVRDRGRVLMYDLKTHNEKDVRAECELYQQQLNVYAHIWKGVRRQALDGTAIIATRLPLELREAIRDRNHAVIPEALEAWQPVIDLPFNEADVQRTIDDFGRCVDEIEDGNFFAPPPEKLAEPRGAARHQKEEQSPEGSQRSNALFAQLHCQNCDGRFSCRSYRKYETTRSKQSSEPSGNKRDDQEAELGRWIEENLLDE